jgi:hypothetical protein
MVKDIQALEGRLNVEGRWEGNVREPYLTALGKVCHRIWSTRFRKKCFPRSHNSKRGCSNTTID